jgi:hypothetical protein
MTARTGLEQDNRDRTTVAGQLAQNSWGTIIKTVRLGQDSKDRKAGTCQPGQVGLKFSVEGQTEQTERTGHPLHDSKNITARHPGPAAGTGHMDRTVRT